MKTQIITIVIIICILPFAGCHVQKEKEKGLEKFRNGPLELCEAIENGNIKAVKAIIKKGIDVDLPAKKDEFPLFYAAGYGRPEIARLLIQAGANVNIRDSYGDTALHIAIRECNYKVAEILINSNADVNAKIEKGFFPGFRPLHTAVNGKKDIPYLVSLLISKGAEVNSRDAKGKTPLQYAIKNRFPQSEQILLKHEKSPGNIQKNAHFPVLKGPYLGQKPPGMTPEIFAPDIISTGLDELSPAFSPDGKTFVFSVQMPGHVHHTMLFTKLEENQWKPLRVFSFSGKYSDGDPAFSPDGNKLFFASLRQGNVGGKNENNWDIWYVKKTEHGWSKPINPGPPINTEGLDTFPSFVHDGTLYFSSDRSEGYGSLDIYRSQYIDGRFGEPENIGKPINTEFTEEGMISSNGKYFIFSSCNRSDSHGGCDLYISFYQTDKSWSKPINMGKGINSNAHEYCPHISSESKYIFFTSFRKIESLIWKNIDEYLDIVKIHNSPGNGNGDIYWVDAKIIEKLKPESLK